MLFLLVRIAAALKQWMPRRYNTPLGIQPVDTAGWINEYGIAPVRRRT
jgi:hypothetical protein